MYYDKITELSMKKSFVAFFMFSLAALPAAAASTCETRVDSHQEATTKQRVAYCLTPEAEAPAAPGPELVYYGVSGSKPAKKAKEEEKERKPVYFDKDGVAVTQNYVDSKNFPPFENDRLSVQDRRAAQEMGKDEASKVTACCGVKMLASAQNNAWNEEFGTETASGLKDRQTKPRRFMKNPQPQEDLSDTAQAYSINSYGVGNEANAAAGYDAANVNAYDANYNPYAPEAASYGQPVQSQNAAYSAAQPGAVNPDPNAAYTVTQPGAVNPDPNVAYTVTQPGVPTGTPQNELQQAYALENNPLGQPSGNAGGAAPNGYMDNDLMAGEQAFGYNSTDPAMQP